MKWVWKGLVLVWAGLVWAELPLPPASQARLMAERPDPLPRSVATWNLQWFPGNRPEPTKAGRRWHEQEVAKIIRRLDVDLLLVQEVVDRQTLSRVAQDYPWRVVSNFQRAGDEDADLPVQNVAILSKVPIRESWEVGFHELPLTPARPVRGFLGARLGTKKNGLTVYTIHLKSNRGGREASAPRRERAMKYLRKDWEKKRLDPQKDRILIGGDFNCSLRNPEFEKEWTIRGFLREGWIAAAGEIPWPKAATTRPDPAGKHPASDFDHILLSPAWAKEVKGGRWRAEIPQSPKVPSDHFPVLFVRAKHSSTEKNRTPDD